MSAIQLPDSLVTRLSAYETRLRRMESIAALGGGLAGLLLTYVLLFVADRFINTPIAARIALSATGTVLAALAAQGWARHWLWNRRGPADLAKLLQKNFRTLGDRLQGVIELTQTEALPDNISPALLRAAIRQVAEDSGRYNFADAVPARPARRWTLAALLVIGLIAVPFVFAPKAATNAAQRWAMPWADIERFTFTTVEDLPRELFVAHGEKFELAVGLRADAQWKPGSATARIGGQQKLSAEVKDGAALFQFPGQAIEGVISLRIGDYLKEIAVHPLHRPELKNLTARIALPAYLGHPVQERKLQGSAADFLEGSSVAFAATIARDVGGGTMTAAGKIHAATPAAATFTTPSLTLDELGGEISLRWKDVHGLAPVQPYTMRIGETKDAAPRVEVQGLEEQELAILPHESIRMTLAATDDFGLKEMWIAWTAERLGFKKAETPKKADQDWVAGLWKEWKAELAQKKAQPAGPNQLPRIAGGQMTRELLQPVTWTPAELGIPQDTVVELTGYALDFFPARTPVPTSKYTIHVLSPEKHAERIREKMDQVLKQLDDRIRDEERALEEAKAITENKKDLNSEKADENIRKVEASEKANEEALKNLTAQMAEIMKDALRNKEILHDTLNEWSKIQDALAGKASPEMQNAQGKFSQAAQGREQREQKMQDGQQHQQNALQAMRDAAAKMQTANENLFARNFYNRLRHAATSEHAISDGLKKLARATVGMKPDEIGDGEKKEFDGIAGRQDGAVKDVNGIQTDMSAFLRRVPNEKYQAVVTEMDAVKVVSELGELAGFVRANLGLKSVGRARSWGDQLNKWADMIQSECNSKGGKGDGEMDPALMELMIAMVRAAVAEDAIRDQTGVLEKQKETDAAYAANSAKLGVAQNQLGGTVKELREDAKFAKFMGDVGPVLEKVEELMREVSGELQKPRTDDEILSTQGIVIELLVPPDKKGGKSGEQSQAMAKMQQRMQQMMQQMTKARKSGGNNSKAASSLAGTKAEGAAAGVKPGGRTVEKTGGAANAGEWPEEFRDALQNYLQSIEGRN